MTMDTKRLQLPAQTCVWFFNKTTRRMTWANKAAMQLFGADSLAELVLRPLDSIEQLSEGQLREYKKFHANQIPSIYEVWEFASKDGPLSLAVYCQDVFQHDESEIYVFECDDPNTSTYPPQLEAAKAHHEAHKWDLERTKDVQDLILPKSELIENESWIIYGKILPAMVCSGDWWWYHEAADSFLIFSADVTGHGTHSAMITSILAASIKMRISTQEDISTKTLLAQVNQDIFETCQKKYYSTLTCLKFHKTSNTIDIHFQGAPPVYILRNDGSIQSEATSSSLIGVDPKDHRTDTIHIPIQSGEKILVVSDGFAEESISGKTAVGERRMKKIFGENFHEKPEWLVKKSLQGLADLTQKNQYKDDVTLIALQRK